MTTKTKTITLIIPCFNEATNIQKGVLDKIGNFTAHDGSFVEVLIVDDGSTDDSRNLVKADYLPSFPKFRLIENPHGGKAQTLITGMREAKGDVVMFTDIDLATPLEESTKLMKEVDAGYRIVVGSRSSHREGAPFLRKVMAVGFIYIRNFFIGLRGIRDTQCGFKAFERTAAQTIIEHLRVFGKIRSVRGSSVTAGFDLEFLFLAAKLGYNIKEIPVTWKHVETKNVNFIRDSMETMKDIVRIKYYDLIGKYQT